MTPMPGQVTISYDALPAPVAAPVEEGRARLRLRLHYRGVFSKEPDALTWRYTGGEVFNESFPVSFKYAELCRKLNDKFGDTVSFKYQAPGEELDPEGLVAVTDDDDLQELYEEYTQALDRPGALQKTFRIRVFVFPALQFETLYDVGDEMETSACIGGSPGINFDSWCSEELSASSNLSGNPSSDTEMLYSNRKATVTDDPAGPFPMGPENQFHSIRQRLDAGLAPFAPARLPGGCDELYPDEDEGVALQGLHNVHQALSGFQIAPEDYGLDDPYHEQDDDAGEPQGQKRLQQQQYHQQQQVEVRREEQDEKVDTQEIPMYNKPLLRVRDSSGWGTLPSHISVFGDASDGEQETAGGAAAEGSFIKLPSQISAFGDGIDDHEDDDVAALRMQPQDGGYRGGAVRQHTDAQVATTGVGAAVALKRRNSRVMTQEFSSEGNDDGNGVGADSLLQLDDQWGHRGANAAGNLNFQLGPSTDMSVGCATPNKQNVLEVVVRVPRASVNIVAAIGEGAFGEVSQALVFPYGSVAIKWLKRERFAKYLDSFQREAEVLAKLNHPNIIRMYGLVTEPTTPKNGSGGAGGGSNGPGNGGAVYNGARESSDGGATLIAGIMTEFVRGGSLAQHLRSYRNQERRLSLRERCLIAWQATLGMAYLHDQSPPIIHFDLKPDNLLVDGEGDNLSVKVADFGLSKHKFSTFVSCRDLRGTLPYMAPELVNNPNQVCEKCDVWSMGVVMWELYTLEVPFQELSAQQILMGLMEGRLHLPVPASCEHEWRWLVEWCMEVHPVKRPSFMQLATKLEAILRQM